jgi:hypothetical protein
MRPQKIDEAVFKPESCRRHLLTFVTSEQPTRPSKMLAVDFPPSVAPPGDLDSRHSASAEFKSASPIRCWTPGRSCDSLGSVTSVSLGSATEIRICHALLAGQNTQWLTTMRHQLLKVVLILTACMVRAHCHALLCAMLLSSATRALCHCRRLPKCTRLPKYHQTNAF